MRGKKLEVSASEMMEMRRQGLSNADIAAVLDISVPTVFKYIGKQGRRMERLAVFADKGKKKEAGEEEIRETKKQMTKPKYVPSEETYAVGSVRVAVSNIVRYLTIKKDGDSVTLSYEQAAELLEFLAWLGREKCQTEGDVFSEESKMKGGAE